MSVSQKGVLAPPRRQNADRRTTEPALPLFAHVTRLMGFHMSPDLHEWASEIGIGLPLGARRRERMELIARRGILFVHVPKNAGTSIATALYGRTLSHETMRFYLDAVPHLAMTLPSIAILRDPVERFVSAYRYARAGGGRHRSVARPFRDRYMAFGSVDDALDHLEQARSLYDIDHIFRPQSWYVTNKAGRPAVRHLIDLRDIAHLPDRVPELRNLRLPHLNASRPFPLTLTDRQQARILAFYHADFALFDHISRPPAPSRTPHSLRRA
jgi:Sulfotransferase family